MKNYYEKYKCFPNPRIQWNRNIYNIRNINISLCDTFHENDSIEECLNECIEDCSQEYYELYSTQSENSVNEIIFRIKAKNMPIFEYTFVPKCSLLMYISNIGGLIGLWFGFAVIDVNKLLKFLIFNSISTLLHLHSMEVELRFCCLLAIMDS